MMMTDDTIKMARKCGFDVYEILEEVDGSFDAIERFVELVRADERHRLVKLCKTLDEPDIRFRYDYRRGVLDCIDLINLKSG